MNEVPSNVEINPNGGKLILHDRLGQVDGFKLLESGEIKPTKLFHGIEIKEVTPQYTITFEDKPVTGILVVTITHDVLIPYDECREKIKKIG